MTSAPRTTGHRRVRVFRKPVIGVLAVGGLLAGAWYATAGAATTPDLKITSTAVGPGAQITSRSRGDQNTPGVRRHARPPARARPT
ncbi:hypothetical protein ACFV23_53815, partial [Streptomyces sp. NPDC059627]